MDILDCFWTFYLNHLSPLWGYFCAAANMNKKRMPRSAKLNESGKLCSHLQTCYTNIDTITCDFPQYFTESDDVIDDNENGNFGEDINTEDDGSLSSELESNFDKETRLWSYKSLSQYKPMMSDNKNLHFSTCGRIQFVVNYEPNRIIELQHPLTDQSGNQFYVSVAWSTHKSPMSKRALPNCIHG